MCTSVHTHTLCMIFFKKHVNILSICTGLLLLALVDLSVGYYTLLRFVETIGTVSVLVTEFENGINFWIIAFGLTKVVFSHLTTNCLVR